ncbi:MAG: hypothetical protein JSS65_15070 [Armatimonadetes bacterium]|nr:hypothetical protein [Armatimonadota bacterium]
MQYFVIWPDGQKFGPATIDVLNGWIAEGRINGDTLLESVVDGSQIKAGAIPGLAFPATAPASEAPAAAPAAAPTESPERYLVVMPDGTKYGPADVTTLRQWVAEGRINAQTNLQEEMTGRTILAGSLPGLSMVQSAAQQVIQQPTYQQPTVPYPRMDPVAQYGDGGKADYTRSLVFSILGFLCCPLVFSSLGIVYGNKAKQAGHPNGQTAVILGVISLVVGMGLGIALNMSRFSQILQQR